MTTPPPVAGRDGVSGGVDALLQFFATGMAALNTGGAREVLMVAVPQSCVLTNGWLFLAKEQ